MGSEEEQYLPLLVRLFEERPIWSRNTLKELLLQRLRDQKQEELRAQVESGVLALAPDLPTVPPIYDLAMKRYGSYLSPPKTAKELYSPSMPQGMYDLLLGTCFSPNLGDAFTSHTSCKG